MERRETNNSKSWQYYTLIFLLLFCTPPSFICFSLQSEMKRVINLRLFPTTITPTWYTAVVWIKLKALHKVTQQQVTALLAHLFYFIPAVKKLNFFLIQRRSEVNRNMDLQRYIMEFSKIVGINVNGTICF